VTGNGRLPSLTFKFISKRLLFEMSIRRLEGNANRQITRRSSIGNLGKHVKALNDDGIESAAFGSEVLLLLRLDIGTA
jgi:hypothetical protein